MHHKSLLSISAVLPASLLLFLFSCNLGPATFSVDENSTGSCRTGNFWVSFSGASFVTGLGWNTGSTSRTISWTGSCTGCNWGPAVYGWMQNPLVEYYIPRTAGGTNQGTYSADGTTYTLITNTQVNKPSIEGTATFEQYFASGGSGSPINFGEHVTGWIDRLGVTAVGSQNYQVVAVENWSGGSGSANVSVPGSNWYTHWIGSGSATFKCYENE